MLAAFSAGCAGSQTIEALLVQRFFAGAFGSAPLTNAGGIISDMFDSDQRGVALCVFSVTPYLGKLYHYSHRSPTSFDRRLTPSQDPPSAQ